MKISYNVRPRRTGKSTICRDKFYETGTMIIDIQNGRMPILTVKSNHDESLNSYNACEFKNILLLRSLNSKHKKEVLIIDEYDLYPIEYKNKINEIISEFEHYFESVHIETTSNRLYNLDIITMVSRIRTHDIPKDCIFGLLRNRYKDQFNELCDHLMTHPKTEIIMHKYIKPVKPVDYIFLNINPVTEVYT